MKDSSRSGRVQRQPICHTTVTVTLISSESGVTTGVESAPAAANGECLGQAVFPSAETSA